jgi:membrane-associated protease RseP (regulator of RpoE activity)
MKTIAIVGSILALSVPAFTEELEKPNKPRPVISSDSAAFTIDRDGQKEMRVITRGGRSGSLKLEAEADEKAEPKTWLGVVLNELSPAVASQLPVDPGTGLIVEHVTPDSPAAKAGLQKHDVLVRLGDQVLIAAKQFQTLVANRKPGDTVEIAFLRKGQRQTTTATIATHQPGDGLGDHKAAINLYDTKIDLDRLLKDASDTAGSIILNKKTVFVGPDGNPVTIDSDEIRERTLNMLKDSGLTREIIEQVKRAISEAQEQVRKAQEQAKEAAQQAQVAAERAVKDFQQSLEKTRRPDTPK